MKLSKFDAVGVNVKVYQMVEDEWSGGIIEEYHPRKGYHIQLFDGQDMWLENLDDVEFEEEFKTDNMEELGETFATTTFHEDELEILKEEDVLQDDPGMTVPDYQTHQEINHSSLRADLSALPSRGVLLSGSVLGAAGLVLDNLDKDGEVFFKVLFVEGGSQPAMFRCKTPIYTSNSICNSISNPIWDNSRFQFDMIMPEDETADRKSPYGFNIQGEIIIAIYVSRSNGGNSLIGQASFQLKDIIEAGTIEYFAAGYEGRSVTGGYTILSRSGGNITGEIDVQLNIAWKSLNIGTVKSSTTGGMLRSSQQSRGSSGGLPPTATGTAAGRPHSASSGTRHHTTTAAVSSSIAGDSRKKQTTIDTATRSGSATGRRPISASATASRGNSSGMPPAPRKIVSNIQRKQREDAARIAKENMKLQKTLQQHANRGRTSPAPTTNNASVYGASLGSTKPMGGYSQDPDPKFINERERINETKLNKNEAKGSRESPSIDVLIKLYNDLKRQTALDEQENVRLRLKVGKLKVSVKQCEMAIDRIHSDSSSNGNIDMQSKATGAASVRSSMRSSTNSLHRRNREGGLCNEAADPKDGSQSARSQHKSSPPPITAAASAGSPAHSNASPTPPSATKTTPYFTPLSIEEAKEMNIIVDLEYKNLAEEYNVLQSVRKGLVERIKIAKYNSETAKEKHLSSYDRMEMIRRRLEYYKNIAGKYAIGIDLHLPTATTTTTTPPTDNSSATAASMHNDALLFDQLRENKQEYITEKEIYTQHMHTIAQRNAIEELNAVKDFLTNKCLYIEDNILHYKTENQKFHSILRDHLNNNNNHNNMNDINYYIDNLREKKYHEKMEKRKNANRDYGNALESEVEERLELADDHIDAINKEIKSIKERQSERKRSNNTSNNNNNSSNTNTTTSNSSNTNTTTSNSSNLNDKRKAATTTSDTAETVDNTSNANKATEYLLDG